MERPTLEEQITISKMTDEELVNFFIKGSGFWYRRDVWLHSNFESLWHIIHWNWFDMWCESEKEVADRNRCWAIKLKLWLFEDNN